MSAELPGLCYTLSTNWSPGLVESVTNGGESDAVCIYCLNVSNITEFKMHYWTKQTLAIIS